MKGNKEYVMFRKLIVDNLLIEIIKDFNCSNQCKFGAVGSVTPFSDYDVSVSGPYATEIVVEFNKRFRKIFKHESAIIFDTNIYGASFVEEFFTNNFNEYIKEGKIFHYVKESGNKDIRSQRIWALIKLNLFLNDKERKFLEKELAIIKDRTKYLDSIITDRDDIQKMNIIYGKTLQKYKTYKNMMSGFKLDKNGDKNSLKKLQSLKEHYKDSLSLTNYFGNEMYFTHGAFIHIVANTQSKMNIPLTKNEYMDSFIENMGDLFKELNHYDNPKELICPILTEKLSKYFSRASNALVKLGYIEEEKSYFTSEEVRKRVRNIEKRNDCKSTDETCILPKTAKQLTTSFFNSIGIKNCSELRDFALRYLIKYLNINILI